MHFAPCDDEAWPAIIAARSSSVASSLLLQSLDIEIKSSICLSFVMHYGKQKRRKIQSQWESNEKPRKKIHTSDNPMAQHTRAKIIIYFILTISNSRMGAKSKWHRDRNFKLYLYKSEFRESIWGNDTAEICSFDLRKKIHTCHTQVSLNLAHLTEWRKEYLSTLANIKHLFNCSSLSPWFDSEFQR